MTSLKVKEFFVYLVIILIIFICLLFFIFKGTYTDAKVTKVIIDKNVIDVELAITPEQLAKGLGGREFLGPNQGMLFVLGQKRMIHFWMKDVKFPLDYIWISDRKIVDITENVPVATSDNLPIYAPKEVVNYVLEVNAGFCEKNQIKIGDTVEFK
jgi:uncharacterized membrane protein (UPF0127 family)